MKQKNDVARTKDSTSGTSKATGSTGRNEKNSTEQETNVARVSASTGVAQPVEVYKEDIISIGYDAANVNGNLVISCSPHTAHIEFMLLRGVLKCYGEQYVVLDIKALPDGNGSFDLCFVTNLPYSSFESIMNSTNKVRI